MSTSRETILGRIRSAVGALPDRTPHPEYDDSLPVSRAGREAQDASDLTAVFSANWQAVSGRWVGDWSELAAVLQSASPTLGYCPDAFASRLREVWPDCPISTNFDRAKIDDYAFGITPAWGAIAETGSIILTDGTVGHRLAALAPWTHVAVVPRNRIFATLADALRQLPHDPSIILVTGPSKTADIEGILIEGVHGPGVQIALVDDGDSETD